MRRITKTNTPEFWSQYLQKRRNLTYQALVQTEEGRNIARKLRESLVDEQKFLCAYCCQRISPDHAHNEHICPKERYPQKSMCYENIVASCETKGAQSTCGHSKQNRFDEALFVSPLQEGCERHFRFFSDGQIEGKTKQGRYTVELLNLNAYRLRQARKAVFEACFYGSKGDAEYIEWYLNEDGEELNPFIDMIQYFKQKGEFDSSLMLIPPKEDD